jgi:hypothetical protein
MNGKPDWTVLHIDMYLDGGTLWIRTTIGDFCIDHRLQTKTPGMVYRGKHPNDKGARPLGDAKEIAYFHQIEKEYNEKLHRSQEQGKGTP